MTEDSNDPDETLSLVEQAAAGDTNALNLLLQRYRDQLTRMVTLRLDRRLQGRVDASDVVQDAVIEAARRIGEYAARPPMEFYVWLRWLTGEKLVDAHRRHLGAQKRDAAQEVSLYANQLPEADSVSIARQLLGQLTTPTQAVMRAELQLMIQSVLNGMDPVDREVLVLRTFEQLTTNQTAEVLGIKRSTAGKRYIMALKRLKLALEGVPEIQLHMNRSQQ